MDRKTYYDYKLGSGDWWRKDVPTANPAFQRGLDDLAGINPFGKPVLRLSWAGTLLHDYTEKPQLKYQITARHIVGYDYIKTDGTIGFSKSMNLAKDAKLPWEFQPRFENVPLGRLRWVVEEWESAESLREKGRFTKLHDEYGNKILRDLPGEGVYNHYFWIQTRDGKYRDPDMQVLTAIQAMWEYDISVREAQAGLDAIEFNNERTIISGREAKSVWAGLAQD